MAEASISVDQDQFCCPVCLDLLKHPVTVPCGHSYCIVCINGCWDQDDQKGVYSCPQCRETFTPRPVLRRNNMLAEVVEKVKKMELQAASPAPCYAGDGDVECDFCTGRKLRASKSCLVCVASLCETHLKPHLEIPALIKHKLVEASTRLQEKICSQHNRLMEIYCHTDQSFICSLCSMGEHQGHHTVDAAAERAEKQKQLKEVQGRSQLRLQEKEKKLQELRQSVKAIKRSAPAAVKDSEKIFADLIRSIEKKCSEVTELIRAQEQVQLNQTEGALEQLEQEIADLKRRDTELEQLSHTEDHTQFFQSFQSFCVSSGDEDTPSIIPVSQSASFDGVVKSLTDLKERLKEEFGKIPPHASVVKKILPPKPKPRKDFLQSSVAQRSLTLKPKPREDFLQSSVVRRSLTLKPKPREDFLQFQNVLRSEPETREAFLQSSVVHRSLPPKPKPREDFVQSAPVQKILPFKPKTRDFPQSSVIRRSLTLKPKPREHFLQSSVVRRSLTLKPKPREDFLQSTAVQKVSRSESKTRVAFLQYFCPLTLDPNTVNHELSLSEKNRVVKYRGGEQRYPDHPDRFDYWNQVLCAESVSGRCYWEVDWSKAEWVGVSVSYKGISRKGRGDECVFGLNSQSWSLLCSSTLSFWHNNVETRIPGQSSSRVGVYVDHCAGTLSFYSVSNTMTLLHTVRTSFTQSLYAGFRVGGTVRLSDPKDAPDD